MTTSGLADAPSPPSPSTDAGPKRRFPRSPELRSLLELLTLSGLVVAQPVLDVFGKSPETFAFREAGRLDILLFSLTLVLVPTTGLWLLGNMTRLFSEPVRDATQDVFVGALLSILGIQVLKKFTPLLGVPLAVLGVLAGGVMLLLLNRYRESRRWLAMAWPTSAAFVAVFLFFSPVSKVFLPQGTGGQAAARAADTPIVFVLFDQLPLASLIDNHGELDGSRFPNFTRLARNATWYRNYTVTESRTKYSLPTILTGQLVHDRSKELNVGDYPNNLFTLLRRTHSMQVFERFGNLCPEDACQAGANNDASPSGSSLWHLLGDAAGIWSDISLPGRVTRDITGQFDEPVEMASPQPSPSRSKGSPDKSLHQQFLESLSAGSRPGLFFMHYIPPHWPWTRYPSGVRYRRTVEAGPLPLDQDSSPKRWLDLEWPVELSRIRHVLQVQFVDARLGDIIDRLKEEGLYDRSLMVVTSDHGHSFLPGGPRQEPTPDNLHEIYWVPLLIKAPHQEGGEISDINIMATDLLPTIADMVDARLPWRSDGASALDLDADRGPVKTITRHQDETPWPTRRLSIHVGEAWKRLTDGALHPARTPSDRRLLPYLVGPGADLIGRRLTNLSIGASSPLRAQLDPVGPFGSVDVAQGPIPAFISGTVPGAPPGTNVAVALNGQIAGVSTTFRWDRPHRFQVLVPDFFFREGENRLELFTLGDEATLHPLPEA